MAIRESGVRVSQKSSSSGEWTHRRMGFHEETNQWVQKKGFYSSKMKQVFVHTYDHHHYAFHFPVHLHFFTIRSVGLLTDYQIDTLYMFFL